TANPFLARPGLFEVSDFDKFDGAMRQLLVAPSIWITDVNQSGVRSTLVKIRHRSRVVTHASSSLCRQVSGNSLRIFLLALEGRDEPNLIAVIAGTMAQVPISNRSQNWRHWCQISIVSQPSVVPRRMSYWDKDLRVLVGAK